MASERSTRFRLESGLVDGEHEVAIVHVAFEVSPLSEDTLAHLTAAEREVASLVVAGLSNVAIAKRRGVARRTVENQIYALFRKLGVRSRAELVALARGAPG